MVKPTQGNTRFFWFNHHLFQVLHFKMTSLSFQLGLQQRWPVCTVLSCQVSSVKTRPNIKPSADARNAKNAANMQYLCKWAAPQGAINGPNEISMPKVAQSAINEKRENILTGLEVASKNNKWKKKRMVLWGPIRGSSTELWRSSRDHSNIGPDF